MPHTQQPSHGHGKGAQPGHKHPKGPSNAAENEAINLANSEAQAHGTHHRHVVNDGTSEIDDVKFMPLPATGAQPATAAAAAPPTAEEVDAPKVRPLPFNVPNYTAGAFAALEEGVRKGTHAIGRLGVKQWTTGVGFVRNPSVFPSDIFIGGIENRGKGLPGDIVVVELKPRSEWKDAQREGPDGSHVSTLFPASKDDKDAPDGAVAEQPKLADGRTIEHVIKHETKARVVRDDVDRVYQTIFGTTPIPVVDWPTNLQPEGKVVEVLERRYEQFQCCRFFEKQQEGQPYPPRIQLNRWYRFKSYSDDFPVVGVYGRDIPENFREKVHEYLFLIQVAPVPQVDFVDGRFPVGRVAHSLGQSGTVAAESTAISYTFKVKDAEFTEEVNACVFEDFQIPSKEELAQMGRRDLRDEEFVTTIDPATARDLDDALSITRTPGGYRVGVHIADVSFFVPVNSALDEEARLRATSTYYVERVIPMLPRKLCEDYCSLNAGVDKFAFSGIWHFDRKGNVQSEWFGQSVIRNRCRMAYEDAQYIIDGDESGNSLNFVNESEPREVLVNKVVESVKAMQELAIILRQNRFDRGALSLNKGKLKFIFEDFNSLLAPKGLTQERSRAANFLVEEFMLHANCRVGEKVVQFMPDCALLRKHDPPVKKKIQHLVTAAGKFGFKITATSSKALRDSLDAYRDHPDCDSLKFMATICMSLAKYTSSDADKQHSVAHYALAAPIYTHFTSPIRRYADLIIHRQLLLALDIEREVGKRSQQGLKPSDVDVHALPHHEFYLHPEEVQNIAEHCNERKEAAKRAGEASMVLFLCLFINATKAKALAKPELPTVIVLRAVVVRLQDNRFTLYLSDIALTIEIFYNAGSQRWKGDCMPEEDSSAFTVNWGSHPQTSEVVTEKLTLFSQVLVTLSPVIKGHMQLDVIVHPPWERDPSRVTPLDFQL